MNTTLKSKRAMVALNLTKSSPSQIMDNAEHYVTSMTNNPSFPSPNPTLVVITAQVAVTRQAYNLAQTKAKGTAGAMHIQLKALNSLLKLLAAYVENVANADAENKVTIINSSGMPLKKPAVRKPKTFTAIVGKAPGSITVNTKAVKGSIYTYDMSTDNLTWTEISNDTKVKYTKTGLTSGTRYYFRVAITTKSVVGNWSPVISVVVA